MLHRCIWILAMGMELSLACTGTFHYYQKGEEIEPGVFNVLRGFGFIPSGPMDVVGTSKMSDLKAHFASLIAENDLVFIGRIDSVIGDGLTNAEAPGIQPEVVLAPLGEAQQSWGAFYARLSIDTLLKGTFGLKRFWFKGYGYGSSCNVYPTEYRGRFLNFSDKFDKMTDLKMPMYSSFCVNCPAAHWFDGRYLYSPSFPVLKLDITELYPDYPATGILQRNSSIIPVMKPAGKAWLPDGRRIPETPESGRKTPLPILK